MPPDRLREFVSVAALSKLWKVEEREIRDAARRAGILMYTLHGAPHADRDDTQRIGEAVFKRAVA